MRKFFTMGLTILSLASISFTAHAEQLQLSSFRNVVTGININENTINPTSDITSNKDNNVKKLGWQQELNSNGELRWKYYDVDGKPHLGGLQLDNKYFYFDVNSGWLTNGEKSNN
ncbi:hypothetical protein [uncultured Clostridium sp.]|uniref:hypothetical protein n=1 Tax=uncultured Clostridium sp. TaxID=59620 RepID=UPI0027DE0F50|nr:hypothetical protein [uncultured Clostridium sp.]